jgi:hypothetical protein
MAFTNRSEDQAMGSPVYDTVWSRKKITKKKKRKEEEGR